MTCCTVRYTVDGSERRCPRSVAADHDRCVFHLTPEERVAADITSSTLRSAFLADVDADDPARREYVDIQLDELDLSALVVDGSDVGRIIFCDVTVDGRLDLSGAVVRHPVHIRDCHISHLDTTTATFEMDVTIDDTVFGTASEPLTCLRSRRGSFERSFQISNVRFDGSVEFAACDVAGWLGFDDVTVAGSAHFPNLTFGTVQFVSTTFEEGAEFVGADGTRAIFEGVCLDDADGTLDLSEGTFDLLRVRPSSDLTCHLQDATVSAGRLDQPEDAVACYDLTDVTLGDVDLDCEPDTFDRYRFYRTRFDGFPFASYREVLRSNRWRLHEYVGTPAAADSIEGLEHTYLEGKQGATGTGDSETASMFFVRELRYRRRRYAAHARASEHSLTHRADAALRWATNGFLDLVAGYGERPQRTLALALGVIVSSALLYPAVGGLVAGEEVVRYGTHGLLAAFDGLYFSVVTFATLGLGDVHPAGDAGRFVAASEGLAGAFLTAVFVFSLGRRVTR
ncbi:potassium channel family protein [Halapricum hydrolyticum]|uniref:Potassium channel family protein n=1 Tax=Halapricum hydrolyticum TaxID=2979991 RepID=A0AAE3IDT3_9EURY|nr:potassium channel family protein [Halapricum hydrolyticum]MCU4718089.1 potassium channel family protein [Halapricum hydrolyticum]MCU4727403.1 potassium channel family protein [Halapricum hydrolyticum]